MHDQTCFVAWPNQPEISRRPPSTIRPIGSGDPSLLYGSSSITPAGAALVYALLRQIVRPFGAVTCRAGDQPNQRARSLGSEYTCVAALTKALRAWSFSEQCLVN